MESSLAHCSMPGGMWIVLNALRHQWNPHDVICVNNGTGNTCSTPCGINGILTVRDRDYTYWNRCAQRLAASMESSPSPAVFVEERLPDLCSTPCGINGILTW